MLDENEQESVVSTYQQLEPKISEVAQLFYQRLFEVAPHTQPLFAHVDMKEQGKKLFRTIAVLVHHSGHLEQIVPELQFLGKRHAKYGVDVADYYVVLDVLMWTIETVLGDSFMNEDRAAWEKLYSAAAEHILEGHHAQ